MNVKEKFLELTSRTYPHGTEKELFHLLGDGLTEDEFGNLFIKIGESDVMFTSHLDTATSALTKVNHVFDKNIIKTDGKSILGADDKAGVTIMLYMIEKEVPGLYYFFLGEEVGCIGSKKVANKLQTEKIEGINKVISFDRRGTTSVITYQSSQRCASDKFGEALALELNKADETFSYKTDDTGVLTDSIQFIKIYSECTNISVGYQSEHTFSETQDIEHLEKLALACIKVNWNDLPVERDPSKTEYKSYGGYGAYGGRYWGDDDDYYNTGSYYKGNNLNSWSRNGYVSKPKTENVWFNDAEFNFVSKVEVETVTKKYVSVDLHVDRISKEKVMIERLLKSLEVDFVSTSWDGMKLVVNYDGNDHSSDADRNDLIEYIPELDYRLLEDELDSDNSNLDYGYLDSIYE
jgi:hypothetical protein